MSRIRIAVSQFPVTSDVKSNISYIEKHIIRASKAGADVIQFSETSLTGYLTELDEFGWKEQEDGFDYVCSLAKTYNLMVILGTHKCNTDSNPYNAVCLIDNNGEVQGWYHKTKLYGNEKNRFSCDGDLFVTNINDVNCGFLICYDSCFPELFQQYRELGVKVLFLSYYNANSVKGKNSLDDLMISQIITRAADNMMYIAGSNSSSRHSRMPACVAYPDGQLLKMERHKSGVLIFDYPSDNLGWTYDNRI